MGRRKASSKRNFTIVDIGNLQNIQEQQQGLEIPKQTPSTDSSQKQITTATTTNTTTAINKASTSGTFVLPSYSVTQHPSVTIKTPEAGKREAQSGNLKTIKGGSSSSLHMEDVPFGKAAPPSGSKASTPAGSGSRAAAPTPTPSSTSGVDSEKAKHIQGKIDDVTKVMDQNVRDALARGERFQDLEAKTEALETGAKQFSKNAQQVRKNLWWKNMKMTIYVAIVILIIVAAIGGYFAFSAKGEKKEGEK